MDEYSILSESVLFQGIQEAEYKILFQCMKPVIKQYEKDEYIIRVSVITSYSIHYTKLYDSRIGGSKCNMPLASTVV